MRTLQLGFAALLAIMVVAVTAYGDDEPAPKPGPSPAVLDSTYKNINQHVLDTYVGTLPDNWSNWPQRFNSKLDVTGNLRVAVDVMLSSVVDSRLRILNSKNVEASKCRMESGYVGVGVMFHFDTKLEKGFEITEVKKDSPAKTANLTSGTTIVEIDGLRLQNADLIEALKRLLGTNSEVNLTVLEGEKERAVVIKRGKGEKLGIGFGLGKTSMTVTAEKVFKNSPAEKAGLREGERITKVNNVEVVGIDADLFTRYTSGNLGDELGLTVVRDNAEVNLKMNRAIVVNEELAIGYSEKDATGMLRLSNLDWAKLPESVDQRVASMNAQSACVIDLRGASGENPELAARLAARFIQTAGFDVLSYREKQGGQETTTRIFLATKDGKLTVVSQTGNVEKVVEQPTAAVTGKLSVLVDEQTSGTAEALALALQRSGRATITGARTANRFDLVTAKNFTVGEREFVIEVPSKRLVPGAGYASLEIKPNTKTGNSGDRGLLLLVVGLLFFGSGVYSVVQMVRNRRNSSETGSNRSHFVARGALLVVALVAGGFAVVYGLKDVHKVVTTRSESQRVAACLNDILRTDEEAREDSFRYNSVERGKLDAQLKWGEEQPPVADAEIEAACRIVTAMTDNDFDAVKKLIESYAYKPYARAQIASALNHVFHKAGLDWFIMYHNGMFLVESHGSEDGQAMINFSPIEEPRVTIMVVDPKYPRQFSSTENADMFSAREIFSTFRTPLIRTVQEFQAKPKK